MRNESPFQGIRQFERDGLRVQCERAGHTIWRVLRLSQDRDSWRHVGYVRIADSKPSNKALFEAAAELCGGV